MKNLFLILGLSFFFSIALCQDTTVSGTPYERGGLANYSFSRRIEYVQVTVDDMGLALEFYVNVIGGVRLDLCQGQSSSWCTDQGIIIKGDEHLDAYFDAEFASGENFKTIPNIGSNGNYHVLSNFILFGNGMVHLMKFEKDGSDDFFDLREPLTSPCYVGAGHVCFWMDDFVDMNYYIYLTEEECQVRNIPNVAWNRPVPQETVQDRNNVSVSMYSNQVDDGAFGGLSWSYFKGPIGEQLELYKMVGQIEVGVGSEYCARGAVSRAYVNTTNHSQGEKERRERGGERGERGEEREEREERGEGRKRISPGDFNIPQKLYGMFQFGYRTDNLAAAVGFYTEVLGGNLIGYPTHGIDIRGDSSHWMILANETLESYEYSDREGVSQTEAMNRLGVANISSTGGMRLDHRFILFDNFVVEALLYTDGLSFGGKPFNPVWDHPTSPAYIGSVGGAFGVPESSPNLTDALVSLKKRAIERGFPDVFVPVKTATFPSDHPYFGFEYSYGKGQAGEILTFVTFNGPFRDALRDAFESNYVVSTLFPETNVYQEGYMDLFCQSIQE